MNILPVVISYISSQISMGPYRTALSYLSTVADELLSLMGTYYVHHAQYLYFSY